MIDTMRKREKIKQQLLQNTKRFLAQLKNDREATTIRLKTTSDLKQENPQIFGDPTPATTALYGDETMNFLENEQEKEIDSEGKESEKKGRTEKSKKEKGKKKERSKNGKSKTKDSEETPQPMKPPLIREYEGSKIIIHPRYFPKVTLSIDLPKSPRPITGKKRKRSSVPGVEGVYD